MARSLFDPSKAAGAASVDPPSQAQQLTVAQAVNLIKTTLEQKIPSPLKIVGEVSNLRANQHWYFSLKDSDAVLHCVAWATAVRKFAFRPKDGDQIVATGQISHFVPQGRTQLYVSELQPVGAGALELRFRALCEELRGLGYFEESRKKPLPVLPRRVAVITSATGAAVHDVINTAAHRCKAVGLLLVDVRVQGEGAAREIARAIKWVDRNKVRLDVDAVIVTRGGGSIEDLWAFNERIVADAVYRCTLPVVAAIGHESDTTIIELVADVRASTPTQAAMRVIPSAQELCAQIEHFTHRLGAMIGRALEREQHRFKRIQRDLERIGVLRIAYERTRVERLVARLNQLRPDAWLAQRQAKLAMVCDRLHRSMHLRVEQRDRIARLTLALGLAARRHLHAQRHRLGGATRHLTAMDPHGVLRRGYSLTMKPDGSLVRSVEAVNAGDAILTRLADGTIGSIVTSGDVSTRNRSKVRRPQPTTADQMDLFNAAR